MMISDKTKQQLLSVIMLLLAALSLQYKVAGVQTLIIATFVLIKKQSWGSAFDLVLALITVIYPATGVIGVIIAYVEYVCAVTQD